MSKLLALIVVLFHSFSFADTQVSMVNTSSTKAFRTTRPARQAVSLYTLIVGSYISPELAQTARSKLTAHGYQAQTVKVMIGKYQYHRVLLHGFQALNEAQLLSDDLYQQGLISNSWITPSVDYF